VYVERLDWLAKNPRFTQGFAMHVGALCREMTNTTMAEAERIRDSTVKDLETIYLQKQVARAGLPAPRAIDVDAIAIRKGHNCRIVVSDLDRGPRSGPAARAAPRRTATSSSPRWARRGRRASDSP
jgi:transposase